MTSSMEATSSQPRLPPLVLASSHPPAPATAPPPWPPAARTHRNPRPPKALRPQNGAHPRDALSAAPTAPAAAIAWPAFASYGGGRLVHPPPLLPRIFFSTLFLVQQYCSLLLFLRSPTPPITRCHRFASVIFDKLWYLAEGRWRRHRAAQLGQQGGRLLRLTKR